MDIDNPYILDILYGNNYVSIQGIIVTFCWIPSHIGIHGNDETDKAAKSEKFSNFSSPMETLIELDK